MVIRRLSAPGIEQRHGGGIGNRLADRAGVAVHQAPAARCGGDRSRSAARWPDGSGVGAGGGGAVATIRSWG